MDLQQSDIAQIKRTLEAALLASGEPVPVTDLRRLFDEDYGSEVIRRLLEELKADWTERGVELVNVASGWRFQVRSTLQRNLDRRVELLVPIEDKKSSRKVIHILNSYFEDNAKARVLNNEGVYERITPSKEKKRVSCQQVLYSEAVAAVKQAEKAGRTTFEPHMAPEDR